MSAVTGLPERFAAAMAGEPYGDEPLHGHLLSPLAAMVGDYVLSECDNWERVPVPVVPVEGGFLVKTAGGEFRVPSRRQVWVWRAARVAAQLAQSGGAA